MKKIIPAMILFLTINHAYAALGSFEPGISVLHQPSIQDNQAKELENRMRQIQIEHMKEQLRIMREKDEIAH